MATDFKPEPTGAQGPQVASAVHEGRRRLLRGSLGTAPVLMMVAHRPVMASTVCTPASSFASINASRPDKQYYCTGRSPGYWKQQQWFSEWPAPYYPVQDKNIKATLFNDSVAFGSQGGYPRKTLLEVLDPVEGDAGGRNAVARAIVAALLNAASGKTNGVLDVIGVKNIWASYMSKGYYEPTAGIRWYDNEIISWINSTWHG